MAMAAGRLTRRITSTAATRRDRPATDAAGLPAPGTARIESLADSSPRSAAPAAMRAMIDNSPRQVAQRRRSEGLASGAPGRRLQAGGAGLPARLKAGLEGLSGLSMDDVSVHYNSARPAGLDALAYTRGPEIHLGPGQERHLPHEAWHAVQQKQGRVTATTHAKGIAIDDRPELEREADQMGARAASWTVPKRTAAMVSRETPAATQSIAQRKVGFEFETGVPVSKNDWMDGITALKYQELVFTANSGNWKVVADSSNMEFVTVPFNENPAGRVTLGNTMTELVAWAGGIPAVVTAARNAGNPGLGRVSDIDETVGRTRNPGLFSNPIVIRADRLTDDQITASPQATAGVRLDQVTNLIRGMVTTTITAQASQETGQERQSIVDVSDEAIEASTKMSRQDKDEWLDFKRDLLAYQGRTGVTPGAFPSTLVGTNIEDARRLHDSARLAELAVNSHIAGLSPTAPAPNLDKLKGLLALVISYLLMGDEETRVLPYSKIIAPLMARTSFYALYRLLDDGEKALFTETFVLDAANLAGTGATQIFAGGFRNGGVIDRGPTRADWIDSIIRGAPAIIGRKSADLMSQGSGSVAAENSSSLGAMSQADTRVTGQRDLAVLEMRRLPHSIKRTEWRQLALDVFDMVVALP